MIDTQVSVSSMAEKAEAISDKVVDKLYMAAQPGAVFGPPVVVGDYMVITASEVAAGGGFGFGMGTAPAQEANGTAPHDSQAGPAGGAGAGGGGGSLGRPIAAIVIGPNGVKVRPIVDATKLALAAITAWGAIALVASRFSRTVAPLGKAYPRLPLALLGRGKLLPFLS
jgi:uncharacterized spore protein YtfJ